MSVSTDQNAAVIRRLRESAMLFPQIGKDAKEELDDIRGSYPDFRAETRQRIPAAERDMYLYCLAAAAHWEEQKHLASNVIRRILGDAEFGYTGRLVFVQRRKYPKAAHVVKAANIDALYQVKH